MFEVLDTHPTVQVQEAEYYRLLGYPPNYAPGERARELAEGARRFYANHGNPWVYVREAELQLGEGNLMMDGTEFNSRRLHNLLQQAGAQRVVLMAVSAGAACEEQARRLWEESKPDEYFFLEIFGSAVVEHLVATTNGRICDWSERGGSIAVPHYSPGYTGWDVRDQNSLHALITQKMSRPFPEPLDILSSGMLRPKKSLIAVVGLAPRPLNGVRPAVAVPCESCALSPCQYRRGPYRTAPRQIDGVPPPPLRGGDPGPAPLTVDARYNTSVRALRKWAGERVRLEPRENGSLQATFRFDGTTCSNQGRPLAFDYTVKLSGPEDRYRILSAQCRPAAGDVGHTFMCAYLSDATGLMRAMEAEQPLLGRSLDDVLTWTRDAAPSGCYCTAAGRSHKWGLALEAIHYALVQPEPVAGFRAGSETISIRS